MKEVTVMSKLVRREYMKEYYGWYQRLKAE
jgi:hypothetical protein